MNRTLTSIVILTFISCVCFSQQHEIDSLSKQLPKTEAGRPKVDLLNRLAFAYTRSSVQEAEVYVRQALEVSQAINYPSGLAESFKILGIIYYVRGEYSLATQYSYESLTLYEKLLDKNGQAKLLNNLALISLAQQDFQKVYDLSQKSLVLKREEGDSLGVATSKLAIAEVYLSQGRYDDAMNICKEALSEYKETRNDWGTSHALLLIGEVYHAQKNYPFALSYYRDALHHARLSTDYFQIINAYKKTGQLYLQTSKFDSAHYYLKRARSLARNKNNRNNEMDANQLLADYFTAIGALDSALSYTKASMAIEREIFNHQKSEQIATMQMLYTYEKKDQELSFQKKIVRRQYVAIVGVSLILVLTVILGMKFYKLNKTNQQAKVDMIKLNFQVSQMNENLENMVQERTEKIKIQNQKLLEFTFFTAHEVRGPVARILGLIELTKLKELSEEDRNQILQRLEEASVQLDEIIRVINRKLEQGEQL